MDQHIADFMSFVEESPTSWHAVKSACKKLEHAGFSPLDERKKWEIEHGGSYYVARGGSLLAFVAPSNRFEHLHLVGAHTDSPALKLKPHAEYQVENMTMFGVEVYGGPLLSSWLNRDLAIAGTVAYHDREGELQNGMVYLSDAPVVVPQLAIHLDRKVNEEGLKLNKQDHLAALAAIDEPKGYLDRLIKKALPECEKLLSHDLFLVPMEQPRLIGSANKLYSGWRVDNLGSVHAALTALLEKKEPETERMKMVLFWDHEEVGSGSAEGAASPFFSDSLERISLAMGLQREEMMRTLASSFCLSVDAAHGLHPNYQSMHEPQHRPLMGKGVTLKVNAQQRYAGDASKWGELAHLCEKVGVPLQRFVNRTDCPCGSTIGPIHSSRTGMPTVDLGYPQLSMHSIRELCSVKDHLAMCKLLSAFFEQ